LQNTPEAHAHIISLGNAKDEKGFLVGPVEIPYALLGHGQGRPQYKGEQDYGQAHEHEFHLSVVSAWVVLLRQAQKRFLLTLGAGRNR
jgi:hypothetical protein